MKWIKWGGWAVFWVPGAGIALFFLYKYIFGSVSVDSTGKTSFKSIATRELRANNPLGVSRSSSFAWEGIDTTYPGRANKDDPNDLPVPGIDNLLGDHLAVFLTTQDGLNAAGWLLHDNYFQADSNEPETLGNKWAGDSQNKANAASRKSYGDSIAQIMGDTPTQTLDYGIDGEKVMQALAREENGTPFVIAIPAVMYQAAIEYGASTEE